MSPRAAWRLQTLGFSDIYDFTAGKLDWMAAGLPMEGTNAQRPRAGDIARKDAPTCSLDERVGDVRERVRAQGWDACAVINDERVVLGLLLSKELDADPSSTVESVMRPGPSTFRPHVDIAEIVPFMVDHDVDTSTITTSDGRLVGILRRADAVGILHREHEGHAHE